MSMTFIEHYEVGAGGETTVVLDNIPGSYTDLVCYFSVQSQRAALETDNIYFNFNSDTNNRNSLYLVGNGTTDISGTLTELLAGQAPENNTGVWGNGVLYIPKYAGSNEKSYSAEHVSEYNGTLASQSLVGGVWEDTSPITSITFYLTSSQKIDEYSTFTLYGITAGSDGSTTVS